jgi:transposase
MKPRNNKPKRRYTRFCGIDVAKRKHVACILDRDGQVLVRSVSFANDAEGFEQLLARLQEAGGPRRVLVAMEATGHYWYSLHDFVVAQGYNAIVLNPLQTALQARKAIRKCKTDKIDAGHIATLIKNGEHRPAIVPGDFAMSCRQLTRLRHALMMHVKRIKQRLRARLHPVWPEYENVFANLFCKTSRTLLATAPTPADLLALDAEPLAELIRKTSRGKYGPVRAQQIRHAAEQSVGIKRGLDGTRIAIRSLLSQLEALRPIRQLLEADIIRLAERLPGYVLTLPGVNPVSAVSLFGETDPIETFQNASQLVAFAGLDLIVVQSAGRDLRPRRHISKRGSPFLRHTLWGMAYRAAYQEGDLRAYWLRRKAEGLHHLAAVTATAIKLTHVAWRILTDRRDYLPARATGKP